MGAEKGGIIDIHLHALSTQYPMGEQLIKPHQAVQLSVEILEDTIAQMDKAGIAQGVISGPDNLVIEWAERFPNRFIACWMPDLFSYEPDEEVARFTKAIENHGVQGLGELLLPYAGIPLNDKRLFALYRICQEQQLPVFFHTGLDGPNYARNGFPLFRVCLSNPLLLEDVAAEFPDLKIVMCHMSYPFTEEATYMLYAHSNVYMDVGIVDWILGRAGFHRLLRQVIETVGADKILFGTDQMLWPNTISIALNAVQEAFFLNDEEKWKILRENALKLLTPK